MRPEQVEEILLLGAGQNRRPHIFGGEDLEDCDDRSVAVLARKHRDEVGAALGEDPRSL